MTLLKEVLTTCTDTITYQEGNKHCLMKCCQENSHFQTTQSQEAAWESHSNVKATPFPCLMIRIMKFVDKNLLQIKKKEKESFPQPGVISQSYTNKSVLLDASKGRGVGSFGCSFCTRAGRTRWWLFVEEGNLSQEVRALRRCGGIG